MKSFECTTEEAQAYIARRHPDGLPIPLYVNFSGIYNHLASAIIFAAMGEPSKSHNIAQLFVAFHAKYPSHFEEIVYGKGRDARPRIRSAAEDHIQTAVTEAQDYINLGKSDSMVAAVDFMLAARWDLDDIPVKIFAVNSSGEAACVAYMGGYVRMDDPNWQQVESSIQSGITTEFYE